MSERERATRDGAVDILVLVELAVEYGVLVLFEFEFLNGFVVVQL